MEAKEKARILEIGEAAEWNRKVIWMEMRETAGMMPVTFWAEKIPFLRFDCEDRTMMIEVRAEYYGKTWRCWDRRPDGQPVPDWEGTETEDGGSGIRKAAGKAAGKRTGGAGK